MAAFGKVKKHIYSTHLEADFDAIRAHIDAQLEEALDPEASAVRKMFNKMREKPEPADRYWDSEHECWLPKGTAIKPHPWDKGNWDNGKIS
jgi:hypothetical protein